MEDVRQQEKEEGTFRREELLGQFTAKKLSRWSDKQYDKEYWGKLERNQKQWKGGQTRGQRTMETIKEEEEEIEQESSELKEQIEEDDNEMGNICNPYYEL